MSLRSVLIGVPVAVLTVGVLAQAPTDRLAFEAASVKPHKPGDVTQAPGGFQPGGRVTFFNFSLRTLIDIAYTGPNFERVQIVGGPSWLAIDRFDVDAKADREYPPSTDGRPPEEILSMLRTLLAERFKLALHTETREVPGYALVLARADGRLGAQLTRSKLDCGSDRQGGPPPPPPPGAGSGDASGCGASVGQGRVTARGRSMPLFASDLTVILRQPVADRTSLSGGFDLDLQWTPDVQGGPSLDSATPSDRSADYATLFTAIQEQLGLRLQPERTKTEVRVIDHVEKPSED